VQNNWGGPSSADKRDWFAGALISLFDERPDTDAEDVETVCLQVMMDEFEVNVEDDSAYDVAEQIMRMRKDCERGNFAEVRELKRRWDEKGGKVDLSALQVEDHGEQGETDGSDDEEDEDDEDEEMGDAPPPAPKEKPLPQIDEDGFETVVSKKRR
jgi:pre-rRNA-processing protein TSR2